MCGIAGIVCTDRRDVPLEPLARMAAALRHRGPDGYGFCTGPGFGFAHVRLSIVDPAAGRQPMTNETGDVVVTYNGEIYNHRELARQLRDRGHVFATSCDTEVLVHGWEEWGPALLDRLDGQFAFALFEVTTGRLILARDRFGVRPLFHAIRGDVLGFASEAKGLFASGVVTAEVDPIGLDEVFTFWGAMAPRTVFRDVQQLPPGTIAEWEAGRWRSRRWYALQHPGATAESPDAIRELDGLLRASVTQRLRADVPVGAYLSGGLDSSITSALAAAASPHRLRTFSVGFVDPRFDEGVWQRQVAHALGSAHAITQVDAGMIARLFPTVLGHVETPLVRTAPVPMFLLSRLAREHGIKVVLTGEGADELFLGYDLFKEVSVRLFCLRHPESRARRALFDRIHPHVRAGTRGGDLWQRSFLAGADPADPLFSHRPRFDLTARIKQFYSRGFRDRVGAHDALASLRDALPAEFAGWTPLDRAAHLEMTTLLAPYLLAAQGDRVGMAHGVEARYPFLDHRLFEFAARLPTSSRLLGLREKEILRRWARTLLPANIVARGKQPYRAPDAPSFFSADAPDWVAEAVAPETVEALGYFDRDATAGLVGRCRSAQAVSVRENQAIVAILSTHLWHHRFIGAAPPPPLPIAGADVLRRLPVTHCKNGERS